MRPEKAIFASIPAALQRQPLPGRNTFTVKLPGTAVAEVMFFARKATEKNPWGGSEHAASSIGPAQRRRMEKGGIAAGGVQRAEPGPE